jgi:DNA-binding SARP family transcriptional activator/Tfp pilus assembly protein PilF
LGLAAPHNQAQRYDLAGHFVKLSPAAYATGIRGGRLATELRFGLLGPLLVRHAGLVVPIPSAKQRVILASLLLDANRVVSLDELCGRLWEDVPPASALLTLRNYVKRLRAALGDADHSQIITQSGGYLIRVGPGELDLARFEASCRAARDAARAQAWDPAATELSGALALWRGDPLADVPSESLARNVVPRLADMRLQALEDRIDADLHLGRHTDVITELRQLTDAHPMRERLHALLMLALYRAGRQADALAAYQRARRMLIDELGIEPAAELRRLHQQILTADPAVAAPTAAGLRPVHAGQTTVPQTTVPRHLPLAVPQFVGRAAEVHVLDSLADEAQEPGASVVIATISGTAGAGKTALAVHWAHRVASRFPDGQLYANLHGYGPTASPRSPGEIIRGFLDALDVPAGRIPAALEDQAGLYRSLLAGQRLLILLDNARDSSQVRPLLPGTAGCLVVATSRSLLTGLAAAEGARQLTLDVMTAQEAGQLLTARLGSRRAGAEPAAVSALASVCARLPLALTVAAARAAARPTQPIAVLATELRDTATRLDALDADDPGVGVRAVLSWSYRQLSDHAARMFKLLGVHPGPGVSLTAAASLAGLARAHASSALRELADAHMLTQQSADRFTCHDLLRAYAVEQAATLPCDVRRAAVGRALDHYLHTAWTASALLTPARDMITLAAAAPGVTQEPLTGSAQALSWMQGELDVILAMIDQAAGQGFDRHGWQLPWCLGSFLDFTARWQTWADGQRTALNAAGRAGDRIGQAYSRYELGKALLRLGLGQEARGHVILSLEAFHEEGDAGNQARSHVSLAMSYEQEGQHAAALSHDEQALNLFHGLGHRYGEAMALNAIGCSHVHLGNYQQALDFCRRALAMYCDLGSHPGQGATWDSLASIYRQLGQHFEAIACYQHAVTVLRDCGDLYHLADALTSLGDMYQAAGDPGSAHLAWQQALATFNELRHPKANDVRARLQGQNVRLR